VNALSNNPNRHPWVRRVLIFIGVAGVLYLGLLFVLSRFLDPETLAASLEPQLERALARDVEIGRAEVGFFPLGMRLQDVSVADPTGLAPMLASVESVEFQVDLIPLFRKQIRIRRLVINTPVANLRVAADGHTNFGDFSAEQSQGAPDEEPGAAEAFSLVLRGIQITGGRLSLINEEDSTTANMGDLQLRADVQREAAGPWSFVGSSEGDVSFGKIDGEGGATGLPLVLSFDILAGPSFEELEIRSGSLGVESVALVLDGKVEGLKNPVRMISLNLRGDGIPLQSLLEALPEQLRSSFLGEAEGSVGGSVGGSIEADLRVEGELGPDKKPRISGTARLAGASLSKDGIRLARNLNADFSMASGGPLLVSAEGEVMDGPFALEGQGEMGGERLIDLRLEAYPDLALIGSVVELQEGVSAQGRIKADVRITGPAADPRKLRFWGEVSPTQLRIITPAVGVPITFPGGPIALQGNNATFRDFPLLLELDQFLATGEIRGITSFGESGRTVEANASIRGPKLNLLRLTTKPLPDPALSYGKVAFARVGGRPVAGRSVVEAAQELRLNRPDSIPLAGVLTLALDTIIDAKGRLENVRAVVEFGPDFLRVSDASFNRYGGRIQANGNLMLGENAQEPFSMKLEVENLDASAFLGANSPLGKIVRGRLSLNLDLVGSLDALLLPEGPTLVGSGAFSLTEGGLNSILITESLATFLGLDEYRVPDIQDWSTAFVLENGRVRLADARLAGAPGEPRVGGSIGLDGGLDLLSVFSLPSDRLGSFARENLGMAGDLAGRVANRPDVVQAVIRIRGSILGPDLEADPGAAAETITRAVGEEVQSEANRRIQEQTTRLQNRASGFLRGLTQKREVQRPPDSLPANPPPPDTIRPDTIRPDTIRPDTIRPDSIPPDTIRPDTLPPDSVRPEGYLPGGR